jgi:hypothetical protein
MIVAERHAWPSFVTHMGHDTAVSQGQRFARLLTDATTSPLCSPGAAAG